MTATDSTKRATLRAVAQASCPDADPTGAVALWLETRPKAEAERWTAAEAALYESVPLTPTSGHRHRWTKWRQSGALCSIEMRRCLDCRMRGTREGKAKSRPPSDSLVAECVHEVENWVPDSIRPRNRAQAKRGPATERGQCILCRVFVTRTSPRRRASAVPAVS